MYTQTFLYVAKHTCICTHAVGHICTYKWQAIILYLIWFWQILNWFYNSVKCEPLSRQLIKNSSHSDKELWVWRAERSQHCLISELLLFVSVPLDFAVVPQLSGGFNSWHVSNDVPKFYFKSRLLFLCRPTWKWLSSIVPPEIITMKSSRNNYSEKSAKVCGFKHSHKQSP